MLLLALTQAAGYPFPFSVLLRCSISLLCRCSSVVILSTLFTKHCTTPLLTFSGWWELNKRYLSVCFCFLCTPTLIVLSSFLIKIASRKGSFPFDSISTVKFIDGNMPYLAITSYFRRKENVSSTYLLQNLTVMGRC